MMKDRIHKIREMFDHHGNAYPKVKSIRISHKLIENINCFRPIETIMGTFSSMLILVGSTEVLLDDSKAVYEKIKSQQTHTKLNIYKNQKHVWPLEDIYTDESQKALAEIQKFITVK